MGNFRDEYVEATRKGIEAFCERVFPTEVMDRFERAAQADIVAGVNVCTVHKQRKTYQRLYPDGVWLCDECAQTMFQLNMLSGRIVFDMELEQCPHNRRDEDADDK